mgnify:CR=1 FL=1
MAKASLAKDVNAVTTGATASPRVAKVASKSACAFLWFCMLAVASSYQDRPIPSDLVAIGEVGLTGEIRSVSNMNQRLTEVSRLGFKTCIIPKNGSDKLEIPKGLTVYRVKNIQEAIAVAL